MRPRDGNKSTNFFSWFDKLTTNGETSRISMRAPFALSASKGERRIPRRSVSAEAGFTLVELLVAAMLSGIALVGIISFYFFFTDQLQTGSDRLSMQRDGSYALEVLSQNIRGGKSVVIDPLGTGTPDRIQVKDSGGTILKDYYRDSALSQLKEQLSGQIIISNVQSLTFALVPPAINSVSINLVLQDSRNGPLAFASQETARLN